MRKRHKTQHPGIYYRLVNEERPDGPRRYIVWYEDSEGTGRTETQPAGSNLEQAKARQSELRVKKSKGVRVVPTKMRVSELLAKYLELRKDSLKPKTYTDYEYAIDALSSTLGRYLVSELTASDIAGEISRLKKAGMKTGTVKKILTPLGGALKVAVREGWIASNPMDTLLPHERPKADQRETRTMERDEIPKLLGASSSDRWRTLFATLIFTGLRIGEALALTWDDIDFQENVIHVRSSKTKAGEREVMLIPSLRRKLMAYKISLPAGVWKYVFINRNGQPVSRREALRALRAAEKRAKLPNYTLHELRHTFASILIEQGESPVLVADQMGHADPGVTLKTYAHLFDRQKNVEQARERLQTAFGEVV